MGLLGDAETAGLIHRAMAVVQIILFFIAVGLIIRFFIRKKNDAPLSAHPDSVLFQKQDWRDLKAMFRWFVNRGEKPEFDRWTYWEKADIFAFFWGMFTIGLSGLILWFPESVAKILPGWVFNVAIIIHSFEAMLATVVIFTAHFFNTHLLPGKFPLDMVMFTGRLAHHDFVKERSLQYQRLKQEGRLEQRESAPLSSPRRFVYGLFGIVSLVLGWVLMAMIVIGLFSM
jgi:cytochrome b subunit of formate dehydrogenase